MLGQKKVSVTAKHPGLIMIFLKKTTKNHDWYTASWSDKLDSIKCNFNTKNVKWNQKYTTSIDPIQSVNNTDFK